jgi:micrococcal nuclease
MKKKNVTQKKSFSWKRTFLTIASGFTVVCLSLVAVAVASSRTLPTYQTIPPTFDLQPTLIPSASGAVFPTFPPTWTDVPASVVLLTEAGSGTPDGVSAQPSPIATLLPASALENRSPAMSCIPSNPVETAVVTQVVDGDTIHVTMNGKEYKVRYIGMDTPEMTGEAYSEEAKARNEQLVMGKTVTMVKDQSETDSFDRLLRFVMVGNTFVNVDLVLNGVAEARNYPPDSSCKETLAQAMSEARTNQLGIWSAAVSTIPVRVKTLPAANQTSCDPSYPDVCIPPAPPDLDCKDISCRNFRVLQPDPHHFDGNMDGLGCQE